MRWACSRIFALIMAGPDHHPGGLGTLSSGPILNFPRLTMPSEIFADSQIINQTDGIIAAEVQPGTASGRPTSFRRL